MTTITGYENNMNEHKLPSILLSVILGLAASYDIQIIGKLSLQEVLLVALIPLLVIFGHNSYYARVHRFFILGCSIWLFVQISTDLIRSIPLDDISRGSARIVFFALSFLSLTWWIRGDIRRLGGFLLGLGFSSVITYYYFPTELTYIDPWKWHFSVASTYIVFGLLALSRFKTYKWLWIVSAIIIVIVCVKFNTRSHAGILSVFAFCMMTNFLTTRIPVWIRLSAVVLFSISVLSVYSWLASTGRMGEEAKNKYNVQFDENIGVFSIILGGRAEARASFQAIKDSPLLGYGSWAKHPEYVYMLADGDKNNIRADQYNDMVELGVIPTHSYIFGAWVDSGPLAALFWFIIWIVSIFCILRINMGVDAFAYLSVFFAVYLLWNIIFSPFGSGNRVVTALAVSILFTVGPKWMTKSQTIKWCLK